MNYVPQPESMQVDESSPEGTVDPFMLSILPSIEEHETTWITPLGVPQVGYGSRLSNPMAPVMAAYNSIVDGYYVSPNSYPPRT
jgi:hypothetical protein